MFSHFFIDRPRFAFVISIAVVLIGIISVTLLPIEQYPQITPPQVQVSAFYPGASAETVENTVAQVIESEINGVEDMMYMSSTSTDGSYSLNITFEIGTDNDIAAVNVQNRLALANPKLPQEVLDAGTSVKKQSSNMLLVYSLTSPGDVHDELFLSNYATINILDSLARLPGVGGASIFGAKEYAMRIWLDPERMVELNLVPKDIIDALREQNVEAAAGQVGKSPASAEQQFQLTINVNGRLQSVKEFEDIIIRADTNGGILRLKDVARIELGAKEYGSFSRFDKKKAIVFAVYQLSGSNALEVGKAVDAEMERLSKLFPEGVAYSKPYDATKFIVSSLEELFKTLCIALFLVILVVYIFLQDWRTTLVPAVAIPVSLIGTLGVFQLAGFSINLITLFGMVLAIGIVVDDAIVVVENAQRKIDEGLEPKKATKESMSEVTSPIIATTLVLLAVFIPVVFTPGIEGKLYQQFALTIAIAVSISSFVALTLSPALCSTILRQSPPTEKKSWFFRWFDKKLVQKTEEFASASSALIKRTWIGVLIFIIFVVSTFALLKTMPKGFIPNEDQGVIFVNAQLPDSASVARTDALVTKLENELEKIEGVKHTIGIRGFSIISGAGSNKALVVLPLEDWSQRTHWTKSLGFIMGQIYGGVATDPGAQIVAFPLPPIMGLGITGGFEFALQDKMGVSNDDFSAAMNSVIAAANQDPRLQNVYTTYSANVPQLKLDVDRTQSKMLGLKLSDVYSTLQAYMGSISVNDFNLFGRVFDVVIQADAEYRDEETDIGDFYARSSNGSMISLDTVTNVESMLGPEQVKRYNMFRYAQISGSPGAGISSGQAMDAMEEVAIATLPDTMGFEWTGSSLEERKAKGIGGLLILSLIFVYLFLVAQYESFMMPIPIVMVMPIAAVGGMGLGILGNTALDLYAQIGILVLAGIASKQAILIVEFAKTLREQGKGLVHAATEALRLRFRAVMMTAFSFILGITPLLFPAGAGAGARMSLGTIVFGGMVLAVSIGTLMVPVFFVMIEKLRRNGRFDNTQESEDA